MKIRKGFQYRLQPTSAQEQLFRQYCGSVRWIWNRMLAERSEAYKATGKSPTAYTQIKQLPVLKQLEETAWLNTIQSQVLQDAVLDLDEAFKRFFSKQNGYPRFKNKRGHKQSFSYPQGVKVDSGKVWLPKIGWVKFRQSREIQGIIKRATIRRKASGWYVSLLCEVDIEIPDPVEITPENSVGIDLGSIDLVTLSDGRKTGNSRHYRAAERKLARAQRSLSRKQKGSNNRHKQKQRVARLHEHIANCRRDDLHKLSAQLIRENQAVFVEDLNVLGIAKRMGKSVGDAGWSELIRQLEYKAAWQGKTVLKIGRYFPSSKTCSYCGYKHSELALSERTWLCPSCGITLDRDINAAINIKREGLKYVAAGYTETQNACGQRVRLAARAALVEARISRL